MRVAFGVLALGVVVGGCGSFAGEVSEPLPSDAKVRYQFNDSSVPPAYHRSFELTVTADQARLIVDSYGDILAEREVQAVDAAWATLVETYPQLQSVLAVDPEQGCVGGTSRSLTITQGDKILKDIFIDDCGGGNTDAAAAMGDWIEPVKQLFPAIDVLAPSS